MKSVVVYFSQTGNTRKVAKAIHDAIMASMGQCDLFKLREADASSIADYDLIGLGCPTFALIEPANVSDFIRQMGPARGKHCFIFSTSGGHPGNALPSMAAKLRRRGFKVIGGFTCDGVDRMPHFTSPWYTEGHPDKIDLEAAASFGREMVERSQRLSNGEKVPMPVFRWLKGGLYSEFRKTHVVNKRRSRGFDLEMTLDREKCRYPKCRACVKNCPVGAIDLSVTPIAFRKGCISCYFCEFICPRGAIKFDLTNLPAKKQRRVEIFRRENYPVWFERASHELIENRSTLYRMLVERVEIGNIDGMFDESHRKRLRRSIH